MALLLVHTKLTVLGGDIADMGPVLKAVEVPKNLKHVRVAVKSCITPNMSLHPGMSHQYENITGTPFHIILLILHTVKPVITFSINTARTVVISSSNETVLSSLPRTKEVSGT